jgi:signal transduction histidine kinase
MQAMLSAPSGAQTATVDQLYEHEETRKLVALVDDAAELVGARGETAFNELRTDGSRWRHEDTYVFVLDSAGNMLVHADPTMEGKSQLDLKDVNGKPIIRGLLDAVTKTPGKTEGWYHYQWFVPGGLLPRWKSSYVRLVEAPSGNYFVVGSGMYNDRMERPFVVDAVKTAVEEIEKHGEAAFPSFRDPTSPFLVKDAYIFVIDMNGVELVNPNFPALEGRYVLDLVDTDGNYKHREMLDVVRTQGSGWVDYMWPKPGESVPTQKSAYVCGVNVRDRALLVGCGVYLADAPKAAVPPATMTASELVNLVREGAAVMEEHGEKAYSELRREGSKWFRDGTYFFVWTMDGTRVFHAPEPAIEGQNVTGLKDVHGRPIAKMILDIAATPSGEGWVHYMYPRPGEIFPVWKSTFVKRVRFPSGKEHIIGCGIYNMQMDRSFIEDVVNRAATLIAEQGDEAFPLLRDKTGPFVFMDTYVFVDGVDGTELVNPAQPTLEGRNLIDLTDLRGTPVVKNEIASALKDGSAWHEYYWFKPGDNTPARKQTFVKRVWAGEKVYIVGSGIYTE